MPENRINIALLLGDPSGIGPELVSKLLTEEITNKANIVVIGEKSILDKGDQITGINNNLKIVNNFFHFLLYVLYQIMFKLLNIN